MIKLNKSTLYHLLGALGLSNLLFQNILSPIGVSKFVMPVILIFLSFFSPAIKSFRSNFLFFLLTFSILLYSIFFLHYSVATQYLYYFLIYTILSVQLSHVDLEKLTKFLSYVLFFCLPYLVICFKVTDIGFLLGISYIFLPGYLSSFHHLKLGSLDLKKLKFIDFISFVNIISYSAFFILKGNRGVILCISLYLIIRSLLFSNGFNKFLRYVSIFFLSILCLVFNDFKLLLLSIQNILRGIGFEFEALTKSINLIESGKTFDSGRQFLINKILEGLGPKDYIFGKGVGYIEKTIGIYSHNIIIQYIIEGGVLYLALVIYILYKLIREIILLKREVLLIFFVGVFIQLLFSNVYWTNPYFWFISYYILKGENSERKDFSNNN